MAAESAAQITRRESVGSWALWFATLAPPAAWATQLIVNYSLEEWFACAPSTQERGEILGLGVRPVALVVTTALAALAVAGLLVAFSCLRRLRAVDDPSGTTERARWMAIAGVFNGILYGIIILASYGPPLLLDTCTSPP